jgi:AbrB family looped-hinge helix DNA binding protein
MPHIATTKMSSKGQIVIPESVREALHLKTGSQFVVMSHQNTIILKSIIPPSASEFSELLAKTHAAAKKAGITKKDLKEAIQEVRQNKKHS